jgi:hypothetical protein
LHLDVNGRPTVSRYFVCKLPRQRTFDLHPDGERIAAAVPASQPEAKFDKVTFIFNFFDELRRIAPPSKK